MQGIIVGGGIAGLSAAIALRKNGIETCIYEATPHFSPVGAGIILAVNAMQIFGKWGIDKEIEAAGISLDSMGIYTQKLYPLKIFKLEWARKQYGYSNVAIHRAKLQEILLKQLPSDTIKTGHRFSYSSFTSSEDEAEKVSAFFENKDVGTASFLIGADGIKSALRKHLFPTSKLKYSGQTCWRGIVDMQLPDEFKKNAVEAWGNGKRFGFLEVADGKVYWYAVRSAEEGDIEIREEMIPVLMKKFKRFAPPVMQIIEQTSVENIARNDLYDLPTLPAWHKGPRCLIGDAAHAATPNMGQGGAQAVEDAWFMADAFKNGGSYEEIFTRFREARINKVQYILENSRSLGNFAHVYLPVIPIRNLITMGTPSFIMRQRARKIFKI